MSIVRKKHSLGIRIKPNTDAPTLDGEITIDSADDKVKARLAGTTESVVTEDQTQTMTNKTTTDQVIDGNVSGTAVDTDNTLAADSDTKIPSQKAVKAYVASQVATKDEASEISYDQSTNTRVVGADVQAALDSIEPELTSVVGATQNNATAISDHLADTVDAHDASAVSNAASGNLVATDVQGALNELQGDIDTNVTDIETNATGISDHLSDAIDAHDATAVSYTNAGSTLSDTEVESALDSLDTKAVNNNSILSGHINDNTGVHGVVAVVGTTDTQTITNKTITAPIINDAKSNYGTASDDKKLVLPQNTKANLDALTREEGRVLWASDEDKLYVDDGTALVIPQSSSTISTVTKTTTSTLSVSGEDNVIVDATAADFVITLPAASGNSGLTYRISKSTELNKVTLDANASETIEGELTVEMHTKNDSIIIVCDGSNWYSVSNDIKISARYTSNSGQGVSVTVTDVIYEDKSFDTHGAMNISTGEYTVPVSCVYNINASISNDGSDVYLNTENLNLRLQSDGVDLERDILFGNGSSPLMSLSVSTVVELSKGDIIKCKSQSSVTSNLTTTSAYNTFTIARIK